MITIIVFSAISIPIYIAALSTPWYYWTASSYISTFSYGVLKFGWTEASYKIDYSTTNNIYVTYSGDLQSTFLTTAVLLGIGGFFCLMTLVNASVYQGVGKKKKNHITFVQRFFSLPLQFLFTFVCFFYFMGSFPKNAAKEPKLCGADTQFVKQLNTTTGLYNLPAFCLKKFYKTYQPLSFSSDTENSIPGPGFWLTLGILVFLVVQLLVIYLVKYKVEIYHSNHSSKKSPTRFNPNPISTAREQHNRYEVDYNNNNNNNNNNNYNFEVNYHNEVDYEVNNNNQENIQENNEVDIRGANQVQIEMNNLALSDPGNT